jgi:aldose 1-epimerase
MAETGNQYHEKNKTSRRPYPLIILHANSTMMHPNQQHSFTHSSGKDIYFFTLTNRNGTEVQVSNYGAIISSFKLKSPGGKINDIVLGFDNMEDYLDEQYLANYPWFGAAVGRYGNRIKNASFQIDGITYPLSKNAANDQLHGGHTGFDKKVWNIVSVTDQGLELSYTSPDGEEGFPGNLDVVIRFELNDKDELGYTYTATTDKPTAVNLTHHSYFNLNNGIGKIDEHELKLYASAYLEQDSNFVVTGRLVATRNTAHDFSDWKKLNKNWNPGDGYDQSFVADKQNHSLSLVAEAWSAQSLVKLQVWSTEPVIHLYTGKYIPAIPGKNKNTYGPFSAFCLETQTHPNAINIPHFPNTVLRPGETYLQQTVYKVFQDVVK